MAMELRVNGWRYQNIRGGVRDLTIDLHGDPRWTLIQMPNGTGKTTTMTLLRAALTGTEPTPAQIAELRADDGTKEGLFELRLEIDGKPFRVELTFDFASRTCAYRTTRAQVQGGGSEPGWHLPALLRRLLSPEFAKLFVFDGEFAKEIRSVGADRTTKSIRTLYRLDQLDTLKTAITTLVAEEQERASEFTSAKEEKGLTRLKNAMSEVADKLEALIVDQRNFQRELTAKRKRLLEVDALVSERTAQDERFNTRMKALNLSLDQLNGDVSTLIGTCLTAMRSPTKVSPLLLSRLKSLGDRLTTLKLPKTISVEFFHELAVAERCVCDTKIGEKEKAAIIAGASKYLAEDQITVINRMKKTVRESPATGEEFSEQADSLKSKLRDRRSVEQQIVSLQQEQIAGGDTELQALLKEQIEIKDRIVEVERRLDVLGTSDRLRQASLQLSWRTNVPMCRVEFKTRKKRHAIATNTHNFVTAADRICGLVDEVATQALDGLRESVRASTNAKLATLGSSEALTVTKIGSALELSSDGVASKGGVSEGQSLSVAYAFLTSLLSAAPYRLPFIVDSPAVSLDTAMRREVGDVIPELFDQMIMFVISSERDGFADAFYPRDDVRYITVWRDGAAGSQMREGLEEFRKFHSIETGSKGAKQ